MNGYFIAAGIVLLYTCFIHTVFGARIFQTLRPAAGKRDEHYPAWLMGCGDVQMITVDLLLSAVCVLSVGVGVLPLRPFCGWFFLALNGLYTLAWLVVLVSRRSQASLYKRLPQWGIFLLVTILLLLGNLR